MLFAFISNQIAYVISAGATAAKSLQSCPTV